MGKARALLGRPFSIFSNPGRGRGYGHKYTVPTVNLARYDELVPADRRVHHLAARRRRMLRGGDQRGQSSDVRRDSFAIESHLLNFHPIELLPETELELIFLKRLRPEIKFPSVEALREQIAKDVHKARRYFHQHKVTAAWSSI